MLIRVSGGSSGIEDYLQKGQKKGRDFERDELDERVILDGHLDITREAISNVQGSGEKYLHITLAFKEDEISEENLKSITQDFKDFTFAAYEPDEYNFYAEAHLPRIKSYINQQTGEFVERKPHIHIVIPEINLLSGHKLNPFGRAEHNIKFLEAFQEHANATYGLASPKDNQRLEFTGESEMISRYKGDIFTGQNKDLRGQILTELIDRKINSIEDFQSMLSEFGEVRIRNKGKYNEYFNVKPPGADKGVNLKDGVFRKEFIVLTPKDKAGRLAAEVRHKYETAGPGQPTPDEFKARLDEWRNIRAREIKYINSGNRKLYEKFREATQEGKREILAERESKFYSRHREVEVEQDMKGPTLPRPTPAPSLRPRLDTEHTQRPSDSLTGQFAYQLAEHHQQGRAGGMSEFQEIKRHLDPEKLLNRLSHSHGVIPEKYALAEGRDGSPRILAGTRSLNVSDFLTKELNLPWKDAAAILREAYADQGRDVASESRKRQPPRQRLWQEFQEHRQRQRRRCEAWSDAQRASRVVPGSLSAGRIPAGNLQGPRPGVESSESLARRPCGRRAGDGDGRGRRRQ